MFCLWVLRDLNQIIVYIIKLKVITYLFCLYIDDMLFIGNSKEMISKLKSQVSLKLEMKNLVSTKFILGMEIVRDQAGRKIWLSQRKYITNVLERFNMTDYKQHVVPTLHGAKLLVNDSPKNC